MANIAQNAISGVSTIVKAGATVGYGGSPSRPAFKTYDRPVPTQDQPSISQLNTKYSNRFDDVNWYAGGAPSGT